VIGFLLALIATARSAIRTRANLAIENLALRQQLAVLRRRRPRPPLAWPDRLFWIALSRTWSRWRDALMGVRPDTVVRWHRSALRRFWTLRSRRPAWTAQQIVEAFPEDHAPKYLMRDRDSIYGTAFRTRLTGMGIDEVLSAPRSPWQNPFVERLIGSIRRECLDHVIVLGERHLRGILASYFAYYHGSRTHLSLVKDAPDPRYPRSACPVWPWPTTDLRASNR
jgi:Integrase core domain